MFVEKLGIFVGMYCTVYMYIYTYIHSLLFFYSKLNLNFIDLFITKSNTQEMIV